MFTRSFKTRAFLTGFNVGSDRRRQRRALRTKARKILRACRAQPKLSGLGLRVLALGRYYLRLARYV